MRLFLAFRVFFAVLFSRDAAQRVAPALEGEPAPQAKIEAPKPQKEDQGRATIPGIPRFLRRSVQP